MKLDSDNHVASVKNPQDDKCETKLQRKLASLPGVTSVSKEDGYSYEEKLQRKLSSLPGVTSVSKEEGNSYEKKLQGKLSSVPGVSSVSNQENNTEDTFEKRLYRKMMCSVAEHSSMSKYKEKSTQSSRDETIREDEDMDSSPQISITGRVLRSEASQFTIGREEDQSYYSRGSNASRSEHPDGTGTSTQLDHNSAKSDIEIELEQYLELRRRKRILEHKLSTTPESATGVLQYNEMPLVNENLPSPFHHEPILAELPTLSNSGAKLDSQEISVGNNRLGVETIYDMCSPIPPSQDASLLVDKKPSKTERPGIETIDDGTSPIPPSQGDNLLQYQGSNDKAGKTDRPGIETIDDSTSPIPPSQDVNLLQYHVNNKASKRVKHGVECIEDTSSPIPPSQDSNILQYQLSYAANKFEGLLPDEVVPSDNSQAVETSTDEAHVRMNSNSSTTNSDSLREIRPPIFTAETSTLSSTRGFTNNNAGDILIPHATLVPEHDSSIPNADIIEPERNAVIVMGRKISHRVLILGGAMFLAVVISLAVALTTKKPEPAVYPTSSPSTSMYPSLTPSFQPSSSPTSIIYSDLINIITERVGYDEGLFSDKQSTRRIALDWLIQDLKSAQRVSRTNKSNYSEIEIFERFTMALFYYETRGDEWDDSYNFLISNRTCDWRKKNKQEKIKKGIIKCVDDQLTILNVADNHVSSPLPPLNNLVNLTQIVMNHNDLDGLIPDLSALSHVNTLDLSDNEFQGNLFDVSNLTQLQTFKVSGNKVSGEVPLSFQDINLTSLHLERTKLNGSLDFLCKRIPSMDINLDCYDDIPEIQCNCCVGCTFVTRECNISNEVIGRIDITKAAQDFSWSIYSIQINDEYDYIDYYDDDSNIIWGDNGNERVLVAAGGMYDEGESVNISLCLSFPGDYLLKTNGTISNVDVFLIGDYSIPLTSRWGNQWLMFSLDSNGLVYDAPTSYPTWSPTTTLYPTTTMSPTSSTDSPTFNSTVGCGTFKTLAPTPSQSSSSKGDATLCFKIQLSTDAFGEETTYYIYNEQNNTPVATKTSFDSNMTYDLEECVDPEGCYYFTIIDEWNDGICCDQGRGNYTVTMNGRVIGQGGEFDSSDTLHIGGSCSRDPEENSCQNDGFALLNVTVKADSNGPSENDWSVWSKNEIIAVNRKDLGLKTSTELVCILETGCYDFYLYDIYGDGWNSTDDAFWLVKLGDEIVGQGDGEFEFMDGISFGLGC
eukprot:scaffold29579_cov60-Cyclotella_meneghiniana.AAC.2